jgi:hypothetical protein
MISVPTGPFWNFSTIAGEPMSFIESGQPGIMYWPGARLCERSAAMIASSAGSLP